LTGTDPLANVGLSNGPERKGWRRVVPLGVTAVIVIGLGAYLYAQRSHVAASYTFRPSLALAIGALVLASLALRAAANQRLFGRLGVSASYRDWFAVVTVNAFTNYLPFSAGLVAKAFYLKRVHAVAYGDFAVGQIALLLLIFATNGLIGIATLALWRPPDAGWIALAFTLMIASGVILCLPEPVARRLADRFARLPSLPLAAIRSAAFGIVLLQIGILLSAAACLALGFGMGQAEIGFAACVIFTAAAAVTRLVSITPGAIGVREFLIGGMAVLTGFELQDAVIASTLVRVVEMGVVFSLGAIFTYTLSDRVASTFDEPPSDSDSRG
jgi:uncharacterized membrane protein YbhN (UPF0104 family)